MSLVSHWKLDETSDSDTTVTNSVGSDDGAVNYLYPSDIAVGTGNGPGGDAADAGFDFSVGANRMVEDLDDQSAAGLGAVATASLFFKCSSVATTTPEILFETGGATNGIALYVYNSKLYFCRKQSGSSDTASITCPTDGNWHHALGYFDASATKLGLILDATTSDEDTSASSGTTAGTDGGGIGAANATQATHTGSATGFDGAIAWVKLFDVDASSLATELAAEGNLPAPPSGDGAPLLIMRRRLVAV